jgi:hypothetical protein
VPTNTKEKTNEIDDQLFLPKIKEYIESLFSNSFFNPLSAQGMMLF